MGPHKNLEPFIYQVLAALVIGAVVLIIKYIFF